MTARNSPYLHTILLAALFVGWLANSSMRVQPLLFLAFGLLSWWSWRRVSGSETTNSWWLLIAASSALLAITLLWNTAFYLYVHLTGYEGDMFRGFLQTRHAPIYGHRALPRSLAAVLTPLVLTLFWRRAGKLGKQVEPASHSAELGAWLIALVLAFGASDGMPRLFEQIGHYYNYAIDIEVFAGAGDLLTNYVSRMPEMSVHNGHYPAGNLLLLASATWSGVPELGRALVILATGGTVWVIGGIAGLLDFKPRERLSAQLLFIASPAVLILPSIALSPLYMFAVALCVQMLLAALIRKHLGYAVALGLGMAVAAFLSFSVSFTGLLIAAFAGLGLLTGCFSLGWVLRVAGVSLVCFVASLLALAMSTGFDLWACFDQAISHNQALMSDGFDSPIRWLIRSTGNLLDYLLLFGPPQMLLCALALPSLWNQRHTPAACLGLATLFTLLIAGGSGLHFLETARIWLYLTPLLALVAGRSLIATESEASGPVLPIYLLFALFSAMAFEFVITTVPWVEQLAELP